MVTIKKASNVRSGPRPIVTNYYGTSGRRVLWTNKGYDPDRAVDIAFSHMRKNSYGAFVAEVYNQLTGELYAVIIHSVVGEIRTLFHYDPTTKVVVTDFDPRVTNAITDARDLDLIEAILKESVLEKKMRDLERSLQEKAHG